MPKHTLTLSLLHSLQVAVTGEDIPPPIASFDEAGWDPKVARNVQRCKYK